ncbi:replication-associated recombination protein A [Arcobacter sp. FWKO B]|uniref:replication-associated recombination protein A n=1 Tax=Arcobacter sp. FWKO B TaxID=2593672 RepID=UPI0018A3A9FE|nr:replication-associated recombination protein A [Arcobacter sp. FWKO B]QOG12233.1 replication-associated recombination protein A [Arcobacter sp. FWKO B]
MQRLATLLKPTNLDEFIGQTHLLYKTSVLYKLITKKEIPHLIFFGKPGSGKTTLAKIIAKNSQMPYYYLNATTIKIDEFRDIVKRYKNSFEKPLIFIDEIHRLSKNQQEVLLPFMENYDFILIGASTENPFYTLTNAFRSRSFLFEFKELNYEESNTLLQRAINALNTTIDEESKEFVIRIANGDGRTILNLIDFAFSARGEIKLEDLKELRNVPQGFGSSSKDSHYDITSALIKSMRGSDIDASLYYLGLLIAGGEEASFIARRLVIFASEDIGNANPNALNLATSTLLGVKEIGYPESRIILAQCVVYLASCPKSNSSYKAINQTLDIIQNGQIQDIPLHIKQDNIGYLYPHDFGGWVDQKYLSKDLKLYESKDIGFEKTLREWNEKIKLIVNN